MMRRKANDKIDGKNLTLTEHLSELRKRIIYSAIFFIITAGMCYYYAETIIRDTLNRAPDIRFIFIAPAELLLSYIKLAMIGGLVISAPLLILQIWLFISPGLNSKDKKYIVISLLIGSIFFVLGVIFAYYVVLPLMITFFIGFQIEEIQPMISFSSYLGFVINTLIAFGVIFELPIMMVLLTRLGIVRVSFLKKNRKFIILIIFVAAAILTPPDIVSQILLALPMIVLSEIGIFLSVIAEKKK